MEQITLVSPSRTRRGLPIAGAVVVALLAGVFLRVWVWDHSSSLHFAGDVGNGLNWGLFVLRQADEITGHPQVKGEPVPITAFLRGYWRSYDKIAADAQARNGDYRLDYTPARLLVMSLWARQVRAANPQVAGWDPNDTWPLLWLNTVCEILSAVGIFWLVMQWTDRRINASLAAAMLVWFDPSVILNDVVFPQWDIWLMPFYIFAACFCSMGLLSRKRQEAWWGWAGVLLAIGGMLKGQIFTVATLFLMWALFRMQWKSALRMVIGFMSAMLVMVLPWLARGSFAWYRIGFRYPMDHFRVPAAGTVYNLPAILARRFGWRLYDPVWHGLTFQLTLRLVFFAMLIACAIGLAMQSRRRNPRALLGFAAPWVLLFAFAPQMHCRYLVWGAVITCIAPALGLGMTLLHLLITAISFTMIMQTLLMVHPDVAPNLYQALKGFDPELGWVVVLVAIILLYGLLDSTKSINAGKNG